MLWDLPDFALAGGRAPSTAGSTHDVQFADGDRDLLITTIGRSRAWRGGWSAVLLAVALTGCAGTSPELHPFTSDGCSLFPDGNLKNPQLWSDCCVAHDLVYWQGGSATERVAADEALRQCVIDRSGNRFLAGLMYHGARIGGHPRLPTWFRWGYGWQYGRGYAPLKEKEQEEVYDRLVEYLYRRCNDLTEDSHGH